MSIANTGRTMAQVNRIKQNVCVFNLIPFELNGYAFSEQVDHDVVEIDTQKYFIESTKPARSGFKYFIEGGASRYSIDETTVIDCYFRNGYLHNIFEQDGTTEICKSILVASDESVICNETRTFIFGIPFKENVNDKVLKLYEKYKARYRMYETIKDMHKELQSIMEKVYKYETNDPAFKSRCMFINQQNYEFFDLLFDAKYPEALKHLEEL